MTGGGGEGGGGGGGGASLGVTLGRYQASSRKDPTYRLVTKSRQDLYQRDFFTSAERLANVDCRWAGERG